MNNTHYKKIYLSFLNLFSTLALSKRYCLLLFGENSLADKAMPFFIGAPRYLMEKN